MTSASTRRTPSWPWYLAAGVLVVGLGLAACGKTGPAGAAGSSGTNTDEGITSGTTLTLADDAPGIVLAVTAVGGQTGPNGTFRVGDRPAITFTVKKRNGAFWNLSEMGSGSIFVSGPTFNYQRVIARQNDLITRAVRNSDRSYTYTFATGIPATYLAPYNDSATYGAGDGELQGQALLDGSYTIGMAVTWNYTVDGVSKRDAGNATRDVLVGATAVAASREVVTDDNCNTCHVSLQMHGGTWRDTKTCVLCHTAGSEDLSASYPGGVAGTSIEFKTMIHRIHTGSRLPSVVGVATDSNGDRVWNATPVANAIVGRNGTVHDFSAAIFPVFPSFSSAMPRDLGYSALASTNKSKANTVSQGILACYKCHGDADGAAGPKTAPGQGNLCYTQPSRRACGSCHDDIDWTKPYVKNGMTMPPQADDASCSLCHATTGTSPASGIAVTGGTVPSNAFAHVHPLADSEMIAGTEHYQTGLRFAVTGVSGSALSYFQAGEKPAISFTVKDNNDVDVPLYRLSAISTTLVGPNHNRQLVFPLSAPKAVTIPIAVDFAGRLVASSTANKGLMSRVIGSTASETLRVRFTSPTAFTLTAGSGLAARGGSSLASATSTNPTGSSVSAVELSGAAVAETITVAFTSPTAFTVTGSVTGAMGSGSMPATTSASTRFTSTNGALAFTITSGTTAFAAGNTIHLTVCQATSGGHLFAIVAGRTAFAAGDRFYYDTVDNALTAYTYNLPMDLTLEFLGDGVSGAAGETFTAGNLPVYWGRETVYERTAMAGVGQGNTTLAGAASIRGRFIDVASAANIAAGDYVVLDEGTAGVEEYVLVGSVSANRIWFRTPLRYAHNAGATCMEVTLTQRHEATNYTLDPATGVVTTLVPITAGNAVVASYRADGAFGWRRHAGDSVQAVYPPPPNDSPDHGQDWGEWQGLAFLNGTYTASVWGSRPVYVTRHNETVTYSFTSSAANGDFLYGAAGTVAPYELVASESTCDSCHDGIFFHGGSRKGNDTCVTCHAVAGMEDWPVYAGGTPPATAGVSANFRTMLHKIHMGEELANASTYTVVGNSGNLFTYGQIVFPGMPGGAKNCEACHGEGTTAWQEPAARAHPAQTTPTRTWMTACNTCHDSTEATTHVDAMTTGGGVESCATCHGAGKSYDVEKVHKNR